MTKEELFKRNNFITKEIDIDILNSINDKTSIYLDTESTGLALMFDYPFLLTFNFENDNNIYYLDLINLNNSFPIFYTILENIEEIIGWNIKFDIHMLLNYLKLVRSKHHKYAKQVKHLIKRLTEARWVDGIGLFRLIRPIDEIISASLKKVGKVLLGDFADVNEQEIKSIQMEIKRNKNKQMKQEFKEINYNGDFRKDYHNLLLDKNLLKELEPIYKKYWNRYHNFYSEEEVTYLEIYQYNQIGKDKMIEYALFDIALTKEIIKVMSKNPTIFIKNIGNGVNVKRWKDNFPKFHLLFFEEEMKTLKITWKQERVSIHIDWNYLEESLAKISYLIRFHYQKLLEIVGPEYNPNSNPQKCAFINKFSEEQFTKCDKECLENLEKETNNEELKTYIRYKNQLTTLNKWAATYLQRFLEWKRYNSKYVYLTFNQFGANTGRFTSDFHQMPKHGIGYIDKELNLLGTDDRIIEEIFNPRKLCIAPPNMTIFYFDFSQMELMLAAELTLQYKIPDPSLLRAFIPYLGRNNENEIYDPKSNKTDKKLYKIKDKNWERNDLHKIMASTAFHIPIDKVVKEQRNIGKTANFAILYGSGVQGLSVAGIEENLAKNLLDAFKVNYPNLNKIRNYFVNELKRGNIIFNNFGRPFYQNDYNNNKEYLGLNKIIQSNGADYLKKRMQLVSEYLRTNKYGYDYATIHDEIQLYLYNDIDQKQIVDKIKNILTDPLDDVVIAMQVDAEYTTTNWAEKISFD